MDYRASYGFVSNSYSLMSFNCHHGTAGTFSNRMRLKKTVSILSYLAQVSILGLKPSLKNSINWVFLIYIVFYGSKSSSAILLLSEPKCYLVIPETIFASQVLMLSL